MSDAPDAPDPTPPSSEPRFTGTQRILIGTGLAGLALAASGGWLTTLESAAPDDDTGEAEMPVERPAGAPPNIVVLLGDDVGYADLGFQGSDLFQTPNLDALAETGVRFTQGYSAAPTCSPARAALLTGRYPQRFGHEHDPPDGHPDGGLRRNVRTVASLLKGKGYTTAAVGKWHLGEAVFNRPNTKGFDHFYGFLGGSRTYLPLSPDGSRAMMRNSQRVPDDFDYLTDAIAEEAAAWIHENADHPFFLYVSFPAVQLPLESPVEDLEAQDPGLSGKRRRLAAMTEALDRGVGSVLGALEAQDLDENTLVFFLSDNGGGQNGGDNSPLRGGGGDLYEGGVRVPFLVRWTGRIERGTFTSPVSSVDIVPTALAAAGVDSPDPLDGVDLLPLLADPTAIPHAELAWRIDDRWALRADTWKLVSNGGPPELYDLDADPGESTDLAAAHPDRVAALRERWEAWNATLASPAFPAAGAAPSSEPPPDEAPTIRELPQNE